jgi:hypothetical protein
MRWGLGAERGEEYMDRMRSESSQMAHESQIAMLAAMHAASDGHLAWDEDGPLIGIEAKASWFDPLPGKWKRTHSSRGAVGEIVGNLKMLRARGFDATAALHLGATAPRATDGHAWAQASHDLMRAEDADEFPLPLPAADIEGSYYLAALVGAVPGTTEEFAGVGGRLTTIVDGRSPSRGAAAPWRARLSVLLADLGRPRFPPPVFVLECPECRRWLLSGQPDVPRHVCAAPVPPPAS